MLIWALVPVLDLETVYEWLVDLVDHGVQGSNGMLGNFSEQNVVVISSSLGDVFHGVWLSGSDKVESLALELDLLSVRHK